MAVPQIDLHDDENVTQRAPAASPACGEATRRDVSTLNGRERVGLTLAARYGMTAAAVRWVGSDQGFELLSVASRSDASTRYGVVYDPAQDAVVGCDCPAHGPCWHIGVARMFIDQCHRQYEREEVYRQTDDAGEIEAMRRYERAHE